MTDSKTLKNEGGKRSDPVKKSSETSWTRHIFALSFIAGIGCLIWAWLDRQSVAQVGPPREILDMSYMPEIPLDVRNRTQIGVENATMFMLVRNYEVQEALATMRQIEDRFNKKFRYPWTFLNDEPFTDEFKRLTTGMASGKVEYGLVPPEHWSLPDHIDEEYFQNRLNLMHKNNVIYGGSTSYRHMCRFNSGFFFRHPLMNQYDWYWRVEPNVNYYCDQNYDPFSFLRVNNKMYGFVISIYEYWDTIPTLWDQAQEFFINHPDYLAPDNALDFLTDNDQLRPDDLVMDTHGSDYNLCHFWSNFEIANLNIFRSKEYLEFFDHLDRTGGFFYERWGDAPVHTIGLSAFLNKSQIHFFSDIGYKHDPYFRCPHDDASYTNGRCLCPTNRNHEADFQPYSCIPKWWHHAGRQFLFNMSGVGHGEYPVAQ